MLQNIKNKSKKNYIGFTLVELLVAVSILGIISVISVQGLYNIVAIRAKQQTIEDSSDSFRILARSITKSVIEGRTVVENPYTLKISTDDVCQTIKYDALNLTILQKTVEGESCIPPDPAVLTINDTMINDNLVIENLTFTSSGTPSNVILMQMEGYYKNSLGDHPIKYETTVTPRI